MPSDIDNPYDIPGWMIGIDCFNEYFDDDDSFVGCPLDDTMYKDLPCPSHTREELEDV